MRTLIKVTQADIDSGIRSDCADCPVARAVYRKVNSYVVVGQTAVRFDSFEENAIIVGLPRSARRFIKRFDYAKPVVPFNFYLQLP